MCLLICHSTNTDHCMRAEESGVDEIGLVNTFTELAVEGQ